MKIAFLLTEFPVLSQPFILSQIIGLIDRGHEVHIYAQPPEPGGRVHPDVDRYRVLGRTHHQPKLGRGYLRRLGRGFATCLRHGRGNRKLLLKLMNPLRYGMSAASMDLVHCAVPLLHRPEFDVVHCHFGPNGVKGIALREHGLLRGRIVTTFHGYDVNRASYTAAYYAPLFRDGDLFTANTNYTAGRAVELGCPPDRVVILPVGLYLSKYEFTERIAERDGTVRLLTVGRLVEKKGIEYSIRAVAKLLARGADVHYDIIGEGPLRPRIQALIRELGVEQRVTLLGARTEDEVTRHYAEAHLFILASVTASDGDREGQGLVLQEAQAMGLPVLTTRHNGIPDGVLQGESGFLVPERDVDALAERVQYLIANSDRWVDMGRAGRAFVEANYDQEKLNDRLVDIYRRLQPSADRPTG